MSGDYDIFREIKFIAIINFHSLASSVQKTFDGETHEFVIYPNRKSNECFFCRLDSGEIVLISPKDTLECEVHIFGSLLEFEFVKVGNEISLWAGKEIASGKVVKILSATEKKVPKMPDDLTFDKLLSAREILQRQDEN